jgi:2-keto-4-pentenoate hydratase/2-oxohepta-3-ene-1,7-dioic acid hydratase in catechol pathway
MKFISFQYQGAACYGVAKDEGIVNLSARFGDQYATLKDVLAAGALEDMKAAAADASADLTEDQIVFDVPIPNPAKIMCAGRNYRAYHEVVEEGSAPPFPSIFSRMISSFTAHNQPLIKPKVADSLDYECELVAVIGKQGRHIEAASALDYVAGYTCMNEGTVREWMKMGTQNFPAKNFRHAGSIGPWMVSADEIPDPAALHITTRRNGEVVQDDGTNMMIFDLPYLIAHTSKFTSLEPGDMIATGSPGGSAIASKPPKWLQPGENLEFEVSGVGVLKNTVADE